MLVGRWRILPDGVQGDIARRTEPIPGLTVSEAWWGFPLPYAFNIRPETDHILSLSTVAGG